MPILWVPNGQSMCGPLKRNRTPDPVVSFKTVFRKALFWVSQWSASYSCVPVYYNASVVPNVDKSGIGHPDHAQCTLCTVIFVTSFGFRPQESLRITASPNQAVFFSSEWTPVKEKPFVCSIKKNYLIVLTISNFVNENSAEEKIAFFVLKFCAVSMKNSNLKKENNFHDDILHLRLP